MEQPLGIMQQSSFDDDDGFFDNFGDLTDQELLLSLSTPPDSVISCSHEKVREDNGHHPKAKNVKALHSSGNISIPTAALRETTNLCNSNEIRQKEKSIHCSPRVVIENEKNHLSNARKRKFPGPAGLLPSLGDAKKFAVTFPPEKKPLLPLSHQNVYSQTSAQEFEGDPWKYMLSDLSLIENESDCPLNNVNIRWVLRRTVLRGQASLKKVPFLIVMIKNIDFSHSDATATFKDRTGEINGTIAASVLENYLSHIGQGSVVVLKDVMVLSPGSFRPGLEMIRQRKRYLTITLSSLSTIYSDLNGTITKTSVSSNLNRGTLKDIILSLQDSPFSRTIIEEEEDVDSDANKSISCKDLENSHSNANNSFECIQSRSPCPPSFKSPLSTSCNSHRSPLPYKEYAAPIHTKSSSNNSSKATLHNQNRIQSNVSSRNNCVNFAFKAPLIKDSVGIKIPPNASIQNAPNKSNSPRLESFSSNQGNSGMCGTYRSSPSPKSQDAASKTMSASGDMDDDLDELMASIDVDHLL